MYNFIFLFFIAFPCFADEWTNADTKRELVYQTLNVADRMFTEGDMRHANQYFIASAVGHLGISYLLPKEWRSAFQYVTIGYELNSINNRFRIGITYPISQPNTSPGSCKRAEPQNGKWVCVEWY